MAGDDEDKTEEPTQKKLQDAKEKGEICRSQEVVTTALFLTALIYANILFFIHFTQLGNVLERYLDYTRWTDLNMDNLKKLIYDVALRFALIVVPFLFAMMFAAVVSNIAQFGFIISGAKLEPKFDRLNPAQGFDRYFKGQTYLEGAKSSFKLFFLFYVLYLFNKREFGQLLQLNTIPLDMQMKYAIKMCIKMGYWVAIFMMVLSVADYLFQHKFYMDKMRMSKYEIKKELKETEGDPLIKSRIRSIQMQLATKRMMSEVPKADVVVTNPTHYAVALKYDKSKNRAPIVVAKGMRLIAEKIKKLAAENKVPIVENPPLARALYKYCKLDREIPRELYQAVAELLAYVYRLTKKIF